MNGSETDKGRFLGEILDIRPTWKENLEERVRKAQIARGKPLKFYMSLPFVQINHESVHRSSLPLLYTTFIDCSH